MAMTLEDAERVWGRPGGRARQRVAPAAREIEDWGGRRGPLEAVPAWAPVAVAGVVGLVVGAALLWVSETQDRRVRAILRRSDLRFADLDD